MSIGSLTLSPIELIWKGRDPTELEVRCLTDVVNHVSRMVPDLPHHVERITLRIPKMLPVRAFEVYGDDELFVLDFLSGSGVYHWPPYAEGRGNIEIDHVANVDFLVALLAHEMAHAIDRSRDEGRFRRSLTTHTRFDKHGQRWSDIAVPLYYELGCQKAALFNDGMAYRSTRNRHSKMAPSERDWLWRLWRAFDQQDFGKLREEFTDLFTNP